MIQPLTTWIFGYGSLVWRPDFDYLAREPAYIDGWARRFWQGSTDHRGVPEAPGRVVTLVPFEQERCWGMAYAVENRQIPEILDLLDFREKNGYERRDVELHFKDSESISGLVYIATPDNQHFLGAADPRDMARQISEARGPSGPNAEYLLRLAESMRKMNVDDPHLNELEDLVLGRQ